MMINSVSDIQIANVSPETEEIKTLDDMVLASGKLDSNFGFQIMYNEWMQNILMSDGVNDEENFDW